MMRRAANSLLKFESKLTAGYSTVTNDYIQVLKTANAISVPALPVEDKEIGLAAGVPLETYSRKARIHVPVATSAPSPQWKLGFETLSKWENPLMGWTSSADPLENMGRSLLSFYTKEEAIAFCKKHGWEYTVEEPNVRRTTRQKRYLSYGDNFSTKRKGLPDLAHLPSNQAK